MTRASARDFPAPPSRRNLDAGRDNVGKTGKRHAMGNTKGSPGKTVKVGVIVVICSIGCGVLAARGHADTDRKRQWIGMACTVVSARKVSSPPAGTRGTKFYEHAVTFEYEYQGTSRRATDSVHTRSSVPDSPGTHRTCFVNPADPSQAVLRTGPKDWEFALMFVGCALGAAVGVGFIVAGLRRWAERGGPRAAPDVTST